MGNNGTNGKELTAVENEYIGVGVRQGDCAD